MKNMPDGTARKAYAEATVFQYSKDLVENLTQCYGPNLDFKDVQKQQTRISHNHPMLTFIMHLLQSSPDDRSLIMWCNHVPLELCLHE